MYKGTPEDKEKRRLYRLKNRNEILAQKARYRLKHREKLKQMFKNRYWSDPILARQKKHESYNRRKNDPLVKARKAAYQYIYNRTLRKKSEKNNLSYQLALNVRRRLNIALKRNYKSGSAIRDLGCSIEHLKQHLESKFQPGMTWENYGRGRGKWNIDHVLPLSSFDLSDRIQFLEAVHYNNLQPLWFEENLKKANKIS